MVEHLCHAVGCSREVPPKLLMCRAHWGKVPVHIQRLIWQTYRPRQEVTKTPSAAYMVVQAFAVEAVASREGKWTELEALRFLVDRMERWTKHVPSDMFERLLSPLLADMLNRIEIEVSE